MLLIKKQKNNKSMQTYNLNSCDVFMKLFKEKSLDSSTGETYFLR